MSPAVGPVAVLPPPGGAQPFFGDGVAPATRELVDREVRRLLEDCYAEAVATLRGNRERLDRLAAALVARETLAEDEAYAAAGVQRGGGPPVAVPRGSATEDGGAPSRRPQDAAAGAR
jgi:cell division protease FtsH